MQTHTKEWYIRKHRQLWNWLAENPSSWKEDWPEWEFNGGNVATINHDCFACKWGKGGGTHHCSHCLFTWGPREDDTCEEIVAEGEFSDGYYAEWEDARNDLSERTRLAEIIRDLPLRELEITPSERRSDHETE